MPKVKIYTTTTCPYCHAEKNYLKSRNIEFEEVLVDKDPEEIPQMLHVCGSMGVPCTHITKDDGTEQIILGFNKAQINSALGLS